MESSKTEPMEMAGARASMYRFFSQLFLAPPSAAALAKLRESAFVADLATSLGIAHFQEIDELCEGANSAIADLSQEYYDLFVVPLGRYITPYESVYREAQEVDGNWVAGLLQGECTLAVLAKYDKAGAKVPDGFLDLPDHIGLEMAFMGFLCETEHDAWKNDQPDEAKHISRLEQEFLAEHLRKWVPSFCHRLHRNAKSPIYRGIARLVERLIETDQAILATY